MTHTNQKEIKLFNKKTGKVQSFKNEDAYNYFCDNSSVFGRWDFEDVKLTSWKGGYEKQ